MTWIWISTVVILIGAKINAELERQGGRRHDNWTLGTGASSPVGRRRRTQLLELVYKRLWLDWSPCRIERVSGRSA
jgi:uncharacterized BrkB/YihY/UPF0761 family membrane protein